MTRLCLLAFLVACSHSDAPPPAQPTVAAVPAADPAPCPDVATQTVKLMPGSERAKPVIERHCIADAWSVELRKCMLLAQSQQELESCQQRFVGTQLANLNHDLDGSSTADTTSTPPTAPTPAAQPVAPAPAPDVPPPANAMPK